MILQGIPLLVGAASLVGGTPLILASPDKPSAIRGIIVAAVIATIATALFMVIAASYGTIAAGAAVGILYAATSGPFIKRPGLINDKNGVPPGGQNYIKTWDQTEYNNGTRFLAGLLVGAALGAVGGYAATQYGAQAFQFARTNIVQLFPVLATL